MKNDIRHILKLTEERVNKLNKLNLLKEGELDYPSKDRHYEEDVENFNDNVNGSTEILADGFKIYDNKEAILRGVTKIAENTIKWEFKKSESHPLLLDNDTFIKINEQFLSFISEIQKEYLSWNERWDERFKSID